MKRGGSGGVVFENVLGEARIMVFGSVVDVVRTTATLVADDRDAVIRINAREFDRKVGVKGFSV